MQSYKFVMLYRGLDFICVLAIGRTGRFVVLQLVDVRWPQHGRHARASLLLPHSSLGAAVVCVSVSNECEFNKT